MKWLHKGEKESITVIMNGNLIFTSFGLAVGFVFGLAMMLGTWLLLLRGQHGGVISSASGLFYGYTYSFGGGIVGFIWGFIYGFIGGGLVAWFNDLFSKMIYKKKS